jgi:hypothetical protein
MGSFLNQSAVPADAIRIAVHRVAPKVVHVRE